MAKPRALAAKAIQKIIDGGQSLDRVSSQIFSDGKHSQDQALIKEFIFGVCRWYGELDHIASQLLSKPLRNKDRDIHFLLLVGLYQLRHLNTADHAAVSETVQAAKSLGKQWSKNLINGCLRSYLREPIEIADSNLISHPEWLRDRIRSAWPDRANMIFEANNQRPPMCLRVNQQQFTRSEYLSALADAGIEAREDEHTQSGVILTKACGVDKLPQFFDGSCSVQDTAAQLAAELLPIHANAKVLDACAAPGGKTAHILERQSSINMLALDISQARTQQLRETLDRLRLKAEVRCADAAKIDWVSEGDVFDSILIDAPCSGTGVIRRHPDIKHHRRESDIDQLGDIQSRLLHNLWASLKPGGHLLYTTCSILPEENQQRIEQFLDLTKDAILKPIHHPTAIELMIGSQTLPGVHHMDGFYYCLLEKSH